MLFRSLIARGTREDRRLSGCTSPAEDGGLVASDSGCKQRVRVAEKRLSFLVSEQRHGSVFAGTHDEIIPTVGVHVEPGDAWAGLAEFSRQQRLSCEFIERFLVVGVVQKRGDIPEHGCGVCGG